MTKALSASLAVFLLATALSSLARADIIPPCALPNGVAAKSLENDAPPALLRALSERVGELVPPGGRFDATDVLVTGKNRRLIFVWNAGQRWIVATEHGGRGYNDPIFVYDLSDDGRTATLVLERLAFPNTVCTTATKLVGFESQRP
jgi:hypothetical protein